MTLRFAKVLTPAAALALLLAYALPAAAQVRVCVDQQGRKTYQQGPCPGLAVNTGIQPLKVERITEASVRRTIELMNKAFSARDTAAFGRFLSADFTSKATGGSLPAGRTVVVDRERYLNTAAQLHQVMIRYEEKSEKSSVSLGGDGAVYRALLRAKTVLPNGELLQEFDTEVGFVIENGELLVRSIVDTMRAESMNNVGTK